MEKSETIGKLAEALAKAQGEIKPAAFDAVNPHFKSRYATLGAITEACKDALSKHGLAVVQGTNAGDGRVTVETMLIHASGEWIKSSLSMKAERDNAQGCGAVITYGRRYSLAAMVGIVADEDTDGENENNPRGGVKNDGRAYKPAAPKQNATTGTESPAITLAEKVTGENKPEPEFVPGDVTVEPVPEVKPAARPSKDRSAGEIAAEIKQIRSLAQKYGCKSADDFAQTMEIITGARIENAQALSADQRQAAIVWLTTAIKEQEAA